MFLFPFRERKRVTQVLMTIFPPPARKRHLTLESLNAPALTPPSHSLSSLFFRFQSSNWFWNLNGCSPISEPQACISFPPFLSAIQLSQLLRFLLFPIHFLWRIFPIRCQEKFLKGLLSQIPFGFILRRTWWPVLKQTWSKHTLQASHSWVHPQIRSCIPPAGNKMCFPPDKTRP